MKADEFGFAGYPADQLTTGGIPLMSFSNYQSVGVRNFRPQFQNPKQIQVLDTVSRVFGQHSLRAGGEMRRKRNPEMDTTRVSPAYTFNGQFTGNSLGDFLLGSASAFAVSTTPIVEWSQEVYSAFVQDDYKVSRNLTVNAGLRYDYTTPFYGAGKNKNINFDTTTGLLVPATDDDRYARIDQDFNNFGPRLGVAYQLKPDRLVLRGGFGVFYSLEDPSGSEGMLAFNPPTTINATLQASNSTSSAAPAIRLSDPFPAGILSNYVSSTVSVKARFHDQQAATIKQWNTAVEMLMPWQSCLEVAYVGNRGGDISVSLPINAVQWGVNGAVAANRPYPQWQQVSMYFKEAQSTFDSLQLKFEKRQSHGL